MTSALAACASVGIPVTDAVASKAFVMVYGVACVVVSRDRW